jgi:hypothetical protein
MNGYTEDVILDKGNQDDKINILSKPIGTRNLLLKVREIVDK